MNVRWTILTAALVLSRRRHSADNGGACRDGTAGVTAAPAAVSQASTGAPGVARGAVGWRAVDQLRQRRQPAGASGGRRHAGSSLRVPQPRGLRGPAGVHRPRPPGCRRIVASHQQPWSSP
jgi:hypothetical protein